MLVYFLGFLGGIALFMYGMQLMGDGLQKEPEGTSAA